jgi:hypothetical protein
MRIISIITVAVLATSLAGCISYSRHEREERVVEHRSGSYRGERSHSYGGYYGHDHDDHHHHRHHPRGR